MKRFLIERPITAAEGTQIFWVDAESAEDALEKHEAGEGGMYADECEVQSLGEPSVCGTTETGDFGDFPPEVSNAKAVGLDAAGGQSHTSGGLGNVANGGTNDL